MINFLKLFLLLVTVIPFIYVVFFIATFDYPFSSEQFDLLFYAHKVVSFLTYTLMVVYMVMVFKLEAVKESRRVLWAVSIFLGSVVAMPIFWFYYVWLYDSKLESTC